MWLHKRRTNPIGAEGVSAYLRVCAGAVFALWMVTRPVRLASIQWWLSPEVASSIHLTTEQRQAIETLYGRHLVRRGRCIERVVEAINRIDQLAHDGAALKDALKETQAAALAADEQRALSRTLNQEIDAVLSGPQRKTLARTIAGQTFD